MGLTRTGYVLDFAALSTAAPDLGSAAILPWDTEIFGFPVARYRPATGPGSCDAQVLDAWTRRNGVRLWLCDIAADDEAWKRRLPDLGFRFVDIAVKATLNALHRACLPPTRTGLRPAEPSDYPAIETLAAIGFHHGRYHADPLFPREFAGMRYRHWMRNALRYSGPADRVYVLGGPGEVLGFYHVTVEDDAADLRLAALSPEFQGTLLGYDLYASMLHVLQQLGVKHVVTSISAANTAVMNVYSALGFRFSAPEIVYHRHTRRGEPCASTM